MLTNERDTRNERLLQVANEMMTAARTAPKGKGFDIIEIITISGETIKKLSDSMIKYSEKTELPLRQYSHMKMKPKFHPVFDI